MSQAASRPLRIFLCHSSGDKAAVRALYNKLLNEGMKPWLDEEDLLPGQDWRREIPKAVRASDVVLVCLSRASTTKAGYVQKEIKDALDVADEQPENTIFIIPVKLEECQVPERLSRWQWVNLFEERGYDKLKIALFERAKDIQHRDSTQPDPSRNPLQVEMAFQALIQELSGIPSIKYLAREYSLLDQFQFTGFEKAQKGPVSRFYALLDVDNLGINKTVEICDQFYKLHKILLQKGRRHLGISLLNRYAGSMISCCCFVYKFGCSIDDVMTIQHQTKGDHGSTGPCYFWVFNGKTGQLYINPNEYDANSTFQQILQRHGPLL